VDQGCDGLHGLEEVRIHDLGRLLELLRDAGVELPADADRVDELTIYAVPMRYDELLDAEPLERDAAIRLMGEVEDWAATQLR
jgi:HEPN domain-containing protein